MKVLRVAAIFLTLSVVMGGAVAQTPAATPAAAAVAPAPAAAKPVPVEVTPKPFDLQARLDAQIAETAMVNEQKDNLQGQMFQQQLQQALAPIQADYNANEKLVAGWIAIVKKENGWGDDVTYNRDTKQWMRTPVGAVPAK